MKKALLIFVAALSFNSFADSIRTADGISCSFDSDDSPFSVETYAETGSDDYSDRDTEVNEDSYHRDGGRIGVKVIYKFGGPRRLDCNELYQLELREKNARVKQLEARLKVYEQASKVEWD